MAEGRRTKGYSVFFSDPQVDQKLDELKREHGLPRGRLLELIVMNTNFRGIQMVQDKEEVGHGG